MNAAEYRALIEKTLPSYFVTDEEYPINGLAEAMRYSLLAGGKRIRPTLVLEFCRISGGDIENLKAGKSIKLFARVPDNYDNEILQDFFGEV